jgi:hypothetical protein
VQDKKHLTWTTLAQALSYLLAFHKMMELRAGKARVARASRIDFHHLD